MVMAVKHFERLFREAASLDIDKSDIRRLEDFVGARLYDLLLLAQATAKANGRDVIRATDLPITKGLQENIHRFRAMEVALTVKPILEHLAKLPPLDLAYGVDLEERMPEVVGGITVSLARVFRALFPKLKNPGSAEWATVDEVYAILL